MSSTISCPSCHQSVDPQAQDCPHCGVNLALAAVVSEHTIPLPSELVQEVPITPEILVPRLGETLVEKGLLRPEELEQALTYQRQQAASGTPLLLGQALIHLGSVGREDLDKAVTEQIFSLQDALKQSNQQLEQRVKERTAELQNTLQKLTELNQLKNNFVSNISHELRTPLAHMIGYIDLLSSEALGPLSEEQTEAVAVLENSYERLQGLIDNLLQFSLAAQGDLQLKRSPTRLETLFREAISQVQSKASAKQIDLKSEIPSSPPSLEIDKEKIGWVLDQLLENAIKFTEPYGTVTLSAAIKTGLTVITVSDTGIGIPPKRLDEIFEPFHQLDGSATRKHGGTGLGLALAQRIVEAHGSKIKVTSQVGAGTTFEFSLLNSAPNYESRTD